MLELSISVFPFCSVFLCIYACFTKYLHFSPIYVVKYSWNIRDVSRLLHSTLLSLHTDKNNFYFARNIKCVHFFFSLCRCYWVQAVDWPTFLCSEGSLASYCFGLLLSNTCLILYFMWMEIFFKMICVWMCGCLGIEKHKHETCKSCCLYL